MFPSSTISGDMIPPLIYLDRYRNEGTRVYSPHADYTEAQDPYRPNYPGPSFDLPVFSLPAREINVYRADPNREIGLRYLPSDRALFCIHPQLLSAPLDDPYLRRVLEVGRREPSLRVSPSSSTRTLYVHEAPPPHAVKVHFPFRVSRYGRRMRDEVVEQAIITSSTLEAGVHSMDGSFAFQREVLGITLRSREAASGRRESWGYLIRELEPFPPAGGIGLGLVPGFALYGRDFFDPGAAILILQLLEARHPRDYVLERIMFPIIRHWVGCFLTFGFLLEPHGQNVLLEVESDGEVGRVIHRDLNVGIDMRRRRDLGLPEDGANTYNRMEGGEFTSITYDKFMGSHFFDFLARTVLEVYPHLTLEDFRGPCRDHFASLLPDHRRYLPRTVHYFDERRDEFGKPLFRDTGEDPVWRP